MAIRVVARIRPQKDTELEEDIIVTTGSDENASTQANLVRLPNPRNQSETFSFQLNSVYDSEASQQDIFDHEISPTIKHMFNGFDVTIFAYGSTGSGKTHTMRGGKTMNDRGIIPRLLSGIYRRARKVAKDSDGESKVEISLSYYEIYNDKVFDLLEAQENRSAAGLSLRDNGAKTVVVGLTEWPCENLKDFEMLYDKANINRSTSATKLNAASSRSHAILGIKVAIFSRDKVQVGVASAIDLAGSEDNRRTGNGKERMVESASINKSLFTLAKCVEAISQNHSRIPYRESKMTRILSLGQNNGLTIMILNLAPTRAFYQDTLCSLKLANRAKKIDVRDTENELMFKGCPRTVLKPIQREPLRPLASTVHNVAVGDPRAFTKQTETNQKAKSKAFAVYADKATLLYTPAQVHQTRSMKRFSPVKRPLDSVNLLTSRPPKRRSPSHVLDRSQPAMSKEAIEDIIERKVADILAAKALDQTSITPQKEISEAVQRRLDLLEQRIQGKVEGRSEGLTFLLCAKQHAVRGEDKSALKMFTVAKPYFPNNKKLDQKIENLSKKLQLNKQASHRHQEEVISDHSVTGYDSSRNDNDYVDRATQQVGSDDGVHVTERNRDAARARTAPHSSGQMAKERSQSPSTRRLLDIINTRDVAQIRLLRGVGLKKAEAIVDALCNAEKEESIKTLDSLVQLGQLKGLGMRMVENMRASLSGQPAMLVEHAGVFAAKSAGHVNVNPVLAEEKFIVKLVSVVPSRMDEVVNNDPLIRLPRVKPGFHEACEISPSGVPVGDKSYL